MKNYEQRRNTQKAEGSRQFQFIANKSLTERLESIIAQRGGNISKALRLLLWLAVEEYEVNRLAGVTTKARLQQQQAVRRANAEAIAAEREMKRQGKGKGKAPLPAASAMLVDDIPTATDEPRARQEQTECEQAVAPAEMWARLPFAEPEAERQWCDIPMFKRHSLVVRCKSCGDKIVIPVPEFEPGIMALVNRGFCCEKCSKEAPNEEE